MAALHTEWAKSMYTVYYVLYTYFWPTLYKNVAIFDDAILTYS